MKKILVATDFSARSDRAIRRAILLAREIGAAITLVHVVDDDQPRELVENECELSEKILADHCQTLRDLDRVDCAYVVALGDPFEGIASAAAGLCADLVILGSHRRSAFKNLFLGTTAERTIRIMERPVLMATGIPSSPWRHILVGVDFSGSTLAAFDAIRSLGIGAEATVTAVHVFDAPGSGLLAHSAASRDAAASYFETQNARAEKKLARFIEQAGLTPDVCTVRVSDGSAGSVLANTARELSADLVVIGTHSRTGVSKLMLGSTAADVFRAASMDVLAVPGMRGIPDTD